VSIRTISSVAARTLAGAFSLWVSFIGATNSLYTLFSPHLYGNLVFLFLNGIALMIEGPVALMSLKFHRLSVVILWMLFLLRIATAIGFAWPCFSGGKCLIPDVWDTLLMRSLIIKLTFVTALMAQIGYILRKPSRASGSVLGDHLNRE